MKVALIHDVLNQLGGAEKVLENFLEIWPNAVINTVFYDKEKTLGQFEKYQIHQSGLNNFPGAHEHPRLYFPVIPLAFEKFDLSEYDLVVSDSSSFAKFVKTDKLHICYCHTPTRFLWTEPDYLKKQSYPAILKMAGRMIMPIMKRWDYKAAQRPDFFIANSKFVKNRIEKYYGRESEVIRPPVDTVRYYPQGEMQDYYLVASRLEPYKRVDLVVDAFNQLGWPLKVAGAGTQAEILKNEAHQNIEFVGRVSDDELRRLYSGAKAFIFPAEEDAGIMVLEAQACGTPVIAYDAGGALETVVEGVTGEFFPHQTVESLITALKNFEPGKYNRQEICSHAQKYDKKTFQQKIRNFVESKIAKLELKKQMEKYL